MLKDGISISVSNKAKSMSIEVSLFGETMYRLAICTVDAKTGFPQFASYKQNGIAHLEFLYSPRTPRILAM